MIGQAEKLISNDEKIDMANKNQFANVATDNCIKQHGWRPMGDDGPDPEWFPTPPSLRKRMLSKNQRISE